MCGCTRRFPSHGIHGLCTLLLSCIKWYFRPTPAGCALRAQLRAMAPKPELWADMRTLVARVPQRRHVRAWALNGWWHTFSYKECHSLVEYAVQADADLASKTAHVSWLLLHGACARKEAKWLQPLQALQPDLGATCGDCPNQKLVSVLDQAGMAAGGCRVVVVAVVTNSFLCVVSSQCKIINPWPPKLCCLG